MVTHHTSHSGPYIPQSMVTDHTSQLDHTSVHGDQSYITVRPIPQSMVTDHMSQSGHTSVHGD